MNNLRKDTSLSLIVGKKSEKNFFDHFFKKIYMVKSNDMILPIYQEHNISILFLDLDKEDTINTIKEIRKVDREVVISLLITNISKKELQELLPLHLSGYIKRPLTKNAFEKLFEEHILVDLERTKKNSKVKIKSKYIFDTEQSLLYDNKSSPINLTKHESTLLTLLSLAKNNFLTTEFLEYSIWEEQSLIYDCNNRLKYLVSSIRKKLPKNSLVNMYGSGYKLVCEEY